MNDQYETIVGRSAPDLSVPEIINGANLDLLTEEESEIGSKLISVAGQSAMKDAPEKAFVNGTKNAHETATTIHQVSEKNSDTSGIFRFFVKNGEYIYARPDNIIMIESCDHLVRVYLGVDNKVKITMRNDTLKDFLLQLPQTQFMRISRFCAVNICRLTGGSFKKQIFEFDFKISIELKHSVSHSVFTAIGK